jgi:hypothetical protein
MEKKFERRFGILTFSIIFLIFITGCGKNESQDFDGPITGEEGLEISFLENFPLTKYVLGSEQQEPITIILDVRNKGALGYSSDSDSIIFDNGNLISFKDYLHREEYKSDPDYLDTIFKNHWDNQLSSQTKEKEYNNNYANYIISEHESEFTTYSREKDMLMAKGKVFIGGFDDGIITFDTKETSLFGKELTARSSINPQGGFLTVEFEGNIAANNLQVEQYDPTILATICYPYKTIAGPNVCVDPDPFDDKQEKVCRLGSHSLTSQGAPIAVKTIDQEASSNKLRFKIVIENVGNGDVIKPDSMDKCGGTGDNRLKRDDFDLVELTQAKVGTIDLLSDSGNSKCGPFAKQGTKLIRLFDGEGFVICSVDKNEIPVSTAYTTPLNIELSYGYRSTTSKSISIKKLKDI